MPEDLDGALLQLRPLLLDPDRLVRAVAAGRRRSATPPWRRVELRPVDLKDGRQLQVVTYDDRKATTAQPGVRRPGRGRGRRPAAPSRSGTGTCRRTTRRCSCGSPRRARPRCTRTAESGEQVTGHDRAARHLLDPGDPLFRRARRRRRQAAPGRRVPAGAAGCGGRGGLPAGRPLRVVDLGCGNAYLTFAAHRFLSADREVATTGIDVTAGDARAQLRAGRRARLG